MRTMRSNLLLAHVLLALSACGPGDDRELDTTGGEPIISWDAFQRSAYREPWEGGKYIVDGDIALADEDALRAYYDAYVPVPGALTVNQAYGTDDLWPQPARFAVSYCVSDDFGSRKREVITAMALAAASWHDMVGVRYRYEPSEDDDCDAENTAVTFDVRPAPSGESYFARAFFPHEGRSSRNLLIAASAFTTTAGGRDFEGILRRELGHTLGFRHEHIWLENGCTGESSNNARQVTSYDVDSVMHYPSCRPSGTGGYRQTAFDYAGARALYGLAPAQILAVMPL